MFLAAGWVAQRPPQLYHQSPPAAWAGPEFIEFCFCGRLAPWAYNQNGEMAIVQVGPTSLATQKWLLGAPAATPAKRAPGKLLTQLAVVTGRGPGPARPALPTASPAACGAASRGAAGARAFRVCFGTEKRCSQTPFGFAPARPTWARRSRFGLARVWCARTRKPASSNAAAPARHVFLEWTLLQCVICWSSMCPPAINAVAHGKSGTGSDP